MAVWIVRGGGHESDFIDRKKIAIDYGIQVDLSGRNKEQLEEHVIGIRNMEGQQAAQVVGVLDRFVNKMKKDDHVLMPIGSDKIRISRIKGNYTYDNSNDMNGFRHMRNVTWDRREFTTKGIDSNIEKGLRSQLTVTKVDEYDMDYVVELMLGGREYRPPETESELINDSNLQLSMLSVLDKAGRGGSMNKNELKEEISNLLKLPTRFKQRNTWRSGRNDFDEKVMWAASRLNGTRVKETGENMNKLKMWSITDAGRTDLKNRRNSLRRYEMKSPDMEACMDLLTKTLQIIIQGPPGTGKTKLAGEIAEYLAKKENVTRLTFHQSYSYEDFIEGLSPDISDGRLVYKNKLGVLREVTLKAFADLDSTFVILIDEINRGNISSIFGEVMTLIDKDKRKKADAVRLPYSRNLFYMPNNILIIGTMNTADRSLISMDAALRRRFEFYDLKPDSKILVNDEDTQSTIEKISLVSLLDNINSQIRMLTSTGKQIGHSYMLGVSNIDDLRDIFRYKIIPLLEDYFMDDYDSLEQILGDGFIDAENNTVTDNWLDPNDNSVFVGHLSKITGRNEQS